MLCPTGMLGERIASRENKRDTYSTVFIYKNTPGKQFVPISDEYRLSEVHLREASHNKTKLVSIILPCCDEEAHIRETLDSLLCQEYNGYRYEILVADGMSKDNTRNILQEYMQKYSTIRMFDNHVRVTSSALEILLDIAKGDYIIRVDGHSVYPKNYIATLVKYLSQTDAANVGGRVVTVPDNGCRQAHVIANVLNSKFGVGISFRTKRGAKPVEVETVPFGAWRREHFSRYGGFDPEFVRAQDLERNIRIRKMGGKILYLPWLESKYFARNSLTKLRKMAFQYGYWKIPVKIKHKTRFSIRQYLPPLFTLAVMLSLPFSLISKYYLLILLSYCLLNLTVSLFKAIYDRHIREFPLYMYCFFLIHFFYGLGYWRGCFDAIFRRKFQFHEISR